MQDEVLMSKIDYFLCCLSNNFSNITQQKVTYRKARLDFAGVYRYLLLFHDISLSKTHTF